MGTLLVSSKIREEYPDDILCSFSVFSSLKISDTVIEQYNATLSVDQLIENSDEVVVGDHEALYNTCFETVQLKLPNYNNSNDLIASLMSSSTTCCLRFAGELNSDLQKLNLIPFSPVAALNGTNYRESRLGLEMFDLQNMVRTCGCALRNGCYLTALAVIGGDIATKEIELNEQMSNMRRKFSSYFVEWIPKNIKLFVCDVAPDRLKMISTFIRQLTAIQERFIRVGASIFESILGFAREYYAGGDGMEEEFGQTRDGLPALEKDLETVDKHTLSQIQFPNHISL